MPPPKPPSDSHAPVSEPVQRSRPRPLRWLKSLLKGRLRLERRGINVHVRLDPASIEETRVPASSQGQMLREAHVALRAALDRHPDARRTLRHLVYLEETIARHGSRVWKKVPPPVLHRAQTQLELLMRQSSHPALDLLHARIAEVMQARTGFGALTRPQELQVMEASHSMFDEMERSWTGQVPLETPRDEPPRS
jgi:hypothetical protein